MLTSEVIARAKAGESKAQGLVLEAASPVVMAKIRRKVEESHCDDIFQEALLDILLSLPGLRADDVSTFFSWALRIVDHTIGEYFGKYRAQKRGRHLAHVDLGEATNWCAVDSSTPDEIAIANESLEEVWELAKSISEATYTTIWMRSQGFSMADITTELGKSRAAIDGIIARFKRQALEHGLALC